jgi:hypothetical protein
MQRTCCWSLLLLGGAYGLLSCLAPPEQSNGAQPYARIALPEAIRLVALDNQTVDPRLRIREIQVTPGPHTLRFAMPGTGRSMLASSMTPCNLRPRWDNCTTHACTEAETQAPTFEPSRYN